MTTEGEEVRFSDIRELRTAADMAGLSQEFSELLLDASRWALFTRTASLGFDAAPSWNAVMRFPVLSADDQTITALVDRLMCDSIDAAMAKEPNP